MTRARNRLDEMLVIGPSGSPKGLCVVHANEISQFYVQRDARGHGNADALLAAGERQLAKSGIEAAVFHVVPENARAIAFYQRNGWSGDEIVDVALETLGEPFVLPCVVLRKNLNNTTI